MIAAGRVSVNGRVAALGDKVDKSKDKVEVDGSLVPLDPELVYYLLNKPAGVVTSASDPRGRITVLDLVDVGRRVWPVGRLDYDSEGALLLTNDGELSHRLSHPSYGIVKTYVARVRGSVKQRTVTALRRGIELDGRRARPTAVRVVERRTAAAIVEISVAEGRHRLVRRLFEAVGNDVVGLVRTAIGPIELGRLKPGSFRRLGPAEVARLYKECRLDASQSDNK
jgi:23S rRNA pseudouridine2605 synthase